MSRCFTWFPIGDLGEPNIYHHLWDFTRIGQVVGNVYSISHSSSPFFLFLIYTDQKNQPIAIKVTMMIIKSLQTICSISDILSLRTHSETIENSFNRKKQFITSIGLIYKEGGRFPQRTPNMRNIILLTDIVSAYTETLRKY